ncbi:MAG TPA: ABC transporter substrate-binding protein [Gaiellaceae bacterium]|nr:ABC transporter substrate-binding protein [Gaiellaceae bacterium]
MRRKRLLSLFMLSMGVALLVAAMVVGVAAAKTAGAAKSGGNLIVTQVGAFDTLDPELSYVSNDWGLLYNTELTLLNFPTKAGAAGTQLIPQAAESYPTVSSDGKTYTFHIRPGLKFSNGAPVTAAAFQRAFERNTSPKMFAPYGIYDGLDVFIQGGQAFAQTGPYACPSGPQCSQSPPQHISGISAKGLVLTIHLTEVVPQFDGIMGMPWFQAVPPSMPYSNSDAGILVYASAGPYYIASNNLTSLTVLKRNPHFPTSSYFKSNWPSNPDQIIVKSYPSSNGDPQLLQAEKNQVDLAGVPSQDVAKTITKYGVNKTRFHVGPTTCITWNALNTASANKTTSNTNIRKALNYGLSRAAIINFAGPLSGTPSDQVLVPAIPGYKKFNVYGANGNLNKAKQIGGSKLAGAPLVIYYRQASVYQTNVAEYIESQASKLGMNPSLQASDPTNFYGALMTKATAEGPNGYNITAYGGWCADYADGYDYLNVNFDGRTIGDTGNTDYMYFNNPRFNQAMDHAAKQTGAKRAAAYGALDKLFMTHYAPIIPTQIANSRIVTSNRVGNWVYSSWWGQPFWNAITLK